MKFRFLVSGNSSRNIWKEFEQKMNHRNSVAPAPAGEAGPGRGPIGATRRPRMNVSELSQIFDPRPARHCVSIDHGTEGHRRVSDRSPYAWTEQSESKMSRAGSISLVQTRIFG